MEPACGALAHRTSSLHGIFQCLKLEEVREKIVSFRKELPGWVRTGELSCSDLLQGPEDHQGVFKLHILA
jgi:hypothetical protein